MVLTLFVAVMLGCEGEQGEPGPMGPQGPVGPVGPAGPAGSSLYVDKYGGILYAADRDSAGNWWNKYFVADDTALVQVWVRQGAGFMWIEPTWYFSQSATMQWFKAVRIFQGTNCQPGYEYMILCTYTP